MKSFTSWFLLSLMWLFVLPGCSHRLDLQISNPCDPAYTGDGVCPVDLVDIGVEHQVDSGWDGGVHGMDVGGGEVDSGSCLCTGVSLCCDGCHPIGEGEVCDDDDGSLCTEHRCSSAGTCDLMVLEGWCLVEGVCHNIQTDPFHCGFCSNECSRSQVCFEGQCVPGCSAGYTDCDGSCFALNVDPLNCGACGVVCLPEEECLDGTCTRLCPPGLTHCAGVCADLEGDPYHCGQCALACPVNGNCVDGECLIPVTGVTLNPTHLILTAGQSEQLVAVVAPDNATDQSLIWSSSDEAVASVSDHGLVTGVGSGAGTITATTVDGGFVATCSITVTVPVSGISITPSVLSLLPGQQEVLSATIIPANATNQMFTWQTSDPGVATVTVTGMVEGVEPGAATITVTTIDGEHQAHCEVTVGATGVTGISITPPVITIIKGAGGVQLQAIIEPADATDQRVLWSSSDDRVAMVNELGVITGLAGGEATVTATSLSGNKVATCEVTVRVPVIGITVTSESQLIPPGGTVQLTITISPEDATDKRVVWTSSDSGIATVSSTGLVTGHDAGYVTITVETRDGGHLATAHVWVGIPATGVEVEPATLFLMPGHTDRVTAIVHPPDATERKVVWTSSNGAVATVDDDGLVSGVFVGDAIITASTVDGGFTALCTVSVGTRVTGVSLTPSSLLVLPGATGELTAHVVPVDATEKTVNWTSGDPEVATVDSDGQVSGVALGETTITVTTRDGGFRATVPVQVGVRVTGVTVAPAPDVILTGRTVQLAATVSPPDATDQSLSWTSSPQAVATVSPSGLVTGISAGTATITATTTDGSHTGSTVVAVIAAPLGYELIPAGTFTMGSPVGELGRGGTESQHDVIITRPYLMKGTPVTQDEWETLMDDNPSQFNTCGSCPVEMVSWDMALVYANAFSEMEGLSQCFNCRENGTKVTCSLKAQYATPQECPGYRLPTEAEWEYAARAGSSNAFYTGPITDIIVCTNLDEVGWYHSNSTSSTHPVGGKTPNDWGLYDMHGNVFEWVWDWYGNYSKGSVTDPYGPWEGSYRVQRGGSWRHTAASCRAGMRYYGDLPNNRSNNLGFRLARTMWELSL